MSKQYNIDTKMAVLLDDPEAKSVLTELLPEISSAGPMLQLARAMSLRDIAKFPQANISPDKLEQIRESLAAL